MSSNARQAVYGLLAVIGLIATWYFNIQFTVENNGFSLVKFVTDNYVNAASASISNDITVVVVTFAFWTFFESRKLSMKYWWLYVILAFMVAIAFAFPLFLLMRERKMSSER